MRKLRLPLLAAVLCTALAAAAQATGNGTAAATAPTTGNGTAAATTPAHTGFFRPQPGDDPSLYRTLPPDAYPQPAGSQPAPAAATNAASPPLIVVVPEPNRDARAELDRARLEAEAARARASRMPAPINGAFTGATDEADRR